MWRGLGCMILYHVPSTVTSWSRNLHHGLVTSTKMWPLMSYRFFSPRKPFRISLSDPSRCLGHPLKVSGSWGQDRERDDVPDWELILFLQKRSLECIARSPSILQLPTLPLEGMDGEAVIISSVCQCYNSACDYVLWCCIECKFNESRVGII